MTLQVGEEDSLWRLELVRGEAGLEATLHRRDYLDTELEVITIMLVMRIWENPKGGLGSKIQIFICYLFLFREG